MAELPTGTVTFLFTDIEGSTRLERELRERYGEVLAEHQGLLRGVFAAHGGHEVDTQGDSFFYVFPRAKAAVEAAVAAQRALASHPWREGGEIRVRIGVNTGEASLEDGRYVGFAVHRAARISAAGHGGQILLSSSTRELVEHDLPEGQLVRDLGERRLKDLPRLERIYQLVVDGLPSEFAPLRTLDEQELAEAAQAAFARRRYRRRIAVAIPVALLVGAGIVAAFFLTRGSETITVQPNSVAVIDPDSNEVVAAIPVGARPGTIAVGEGSVWVANLEDETVSRVNPRARIVERTISVDAFPSDVAVGAGAVWVLNAPFNRVTRVDPGSNGTRTIELPLPGFVGGRRPPLDCGQATAGGIAFGAQRIWIICPDGLLIRINPKDDGPESLGFAGGFGTIAIAAGGGSVWVADRDENTVFRISPTSGEATAEVTVLNSPTSIAVGAGAVWVANSGDEALSRIDISEPGLRFTSTSVQIGATAVDVAANEGAIWTANSGDGTVTRIDPVSNEVAETIDVGNAPAAIAAGYGLVWVSVQEPLTGTETSG
jgi:YVTN family beta-propeller protein